MFEFTIEAHGITREPTDEQLEEEFRKEIQELRNTLEREVNNWKNKHNLNNRVEINFSTF